MCPPSRVAGIVTAVVLAAGCRTATFPAAPSARPPWATRPAERQTPAAGLGVIAGRVTAADSGEPIARARVVVTSPALEGARVVLTGPDGRYRVGDLPAGRYTVAVVKTGFATVTVGDDAGTGPVELAPEALRRDLDVALVRAGVVSGRVRDEDGSPLEGARIEVWRPRVGGGPPSLVVVGRAVTDDRGEFRVTGVPPGFYLVSGTDPAWDAAADAGGLLNHPPTFYPGVLNPDEAARVVVDAGRDTGGLEWTIRVARPVRVSGRLTAHDGHPLRTGAIVMTAEGPGRRLFPVTLSAADVVLRPDGTFVMRNVAPGRYIIRARGQTVDDSTPLFGSFAVSVEDRDLENVVVRLAPGGTVEGNLDVEAARGTPRPRLADLRVRGVSADGAAFAEALGDPVGPDGRFVVRGLAEGRYVFRVDGLRGSWILKDVLLRGRSIVDLPIALDVGQRLEGVRIVLSDVSASLGGTVRTADGRLAGSGSVVVFAVDPALWTPYSRHLRVARIERDGRYRATSLPPGPYWAVAIDLAIAPADLDIVALERLAARGTRATLGDGESVVLDLELMSLPAARLAGRPELTSQPSSSYSPSARGTTRVDGRSASR